MRVADLPQVTFGVEGTAAAEVVRDAVVVLIGAVATLGDGIGASAAVVVEAVGEAIAVVVLAVGSGPGAKLRAGWVAGVAV